MTGGISNAHWLRILGIIKKHRNISAVILYGSRAKGNFQSGSDIDLALKGKTITSEQLTEIGLDYENLYLPWKLSLTIYEDIAHAELVDHIDRVGIDLLPLF